MCWLWNKKKKEEKKDNVKEEQSKETVSTKKPDSKKVASKKVEKEPVVKETSKEESAPVTKAEAPVESEEKSAAKKKMYHVSKRASDNKWTVKYAGGEKVIKLFDTKVEALEYANKLAENHEGGVQFHASKGKYKGKIRSAK